LGQVAKDAMSREQQFLSHLGDIERVIAWVSSRRGLRGADAEDFASSVKLRLIENDYEVLARFEGRSSFRTYLAAVVNHLYLDFQVRRFGKWRPSAAARRLGPVALRLERLMDRDGLGFEEACGVLQSDPRVKEGRDALYAMSESLRSRPPSAPAGAGREAVSEETAASRLERGERQALADRAFPLVRRSLSRLDARDVVFFRLLFETGLTVAQAARSLGLDQRALYRRKEEILARLRSDLEAAGIDAVAAQELLSRLDWEAALGLDSPQSVPPPEKSGSRPSEGRDASTRLRGGP
jgi:RNA polymerase sigma factor for flagellar operon FliA